MQNGKKLEEGKGRADERVSNTATNCVSLFDSIIISQLWRWDFFFVGTNEYYYGRRLECMCVSSRMKILIEKFSDGRMWASECWHRMPNANIVSRNICNSHWFSMKIEDSDFFCFFRSTHTYVNTRHTDCTLNFLFSEKSLDFSSPSLYFVREDEILCGYLGCRVVAVIKKICLFFFLLIRKTVSIGWFMFSRCDFIGLERQHKIYYWFRIFRNFDIGVGRTHHIDRRHFDWRHITEKT